MGNEDLVLYLLRSGTIDKTIANAMRKIDRADFLPKRYGSRAYADYALPTDKGQTISQPTIVGIMTKHLDVKKGMTILEIGTGSGYQTAILSKLVGLKGKIYSVEAIEELVQMARENLDKVRIKNVEIIQGDGSAGWKEKAPFDRIIVTASAPKIPKPLLDQLKPNGKMVIPIGSNVAQELILLEKKKKITQRSILPVIFVPLIGKYAHKSEKQ